VAARAIGADGVPTNQPTTGTGTAVGTGRARVAAPSWGVTAAGPTTTSTRCAWRTGATGSGSRA